MSGDRVKPIMPRGYRETNARVQANRVPKDFKPRDKSRRDRRSMPTVPNRKVKITLPYVSCQHELDE